LLFCGEQGVTQRVETLVAIQSGYHSTLAYDVAAARLRDELSRMITVHDYLTSKHAPHRGSSQVRCDDADNDNHARACE
jgi:hypothetical protein